MKKIWQHKTWNTLIRSIWISTCTLAFCLYCQYSSNTYICTCCWLLYIAALSFAQYNICFMGNTTDMMKSLIVDLIYLQVWQCSSTMLFAGHKFKFKFPAISRLFQQSVPSNTYDVSYHRSTVYDNFGSAQAHRWKE